ncbi:MAG: hypothetical protein RR219_01015 [Clostridiales bacterium]
MEQIMDFIFDNFWIFILGLIFLSGFKKSKKKKGAPVDQGENVEQPQYDSEPWDDEDMEENWDERKQQMPTIPDNIPIPASLKKVLQEYDDKPFKKRESPWQEEPEQQKQPQEGQYKYPMTGQFGESIPRQDNTPVGSEGKENPYQPVLPTNTMEPEFGNEGKYIAKSVMRPQAKPSYVEESPFDYNDKAKIKELADSFMRSKIENDAYAPKLSKVVMMNKAKLMEAVVMSEILAKPKAMRKRG